MASEPVTARARRVGQRRDRVFDAAIELFVEQGYDATTMDDIAVRADVARTSVFNYFERKTAFLDEWSARRRARAFHATPREAGGSLRDELASITRELAAISDASRVATTAIIGAALRELDLLDDHPLSHEFLAVIGRHREDLRDDVDPGLVGLTLATGYFAVLRAWIGAGPPPFDLTTRLLALLDLLLDGASRPAS
ncbi:helix-turn-helix domain-containing protein [Nocardioides sp. LHD-245]|uniref:TetR/AcrR family transcriptional regulator n=1 Tax=Nocardioides sp. LHD-245 TaxID=3051387 RepID=UPI0027E1B6C0|nr:helix-turn-helix domain-containing protein [Nocardioides sp. LHD-245]